MLDHCDVARVDTELLSERLLGQPQRFAPRLQEFVELFPPFHLVCSPKPHPPRVSCLERVAYQTVGYPTMLPAAALMVRGYPKRHDHLPNLTFCRSENGGEPP